MKILTKFLKQHAAILSLVFVLVAINALLMVSVPLLSGVAINSIVHRRPVPEVVGAAAVTASLAFLAAFVGLLERRLGGRVGEGVVKQLRIDIFTHYQRLGLDYFVESSSGSMVSRTLNDVVAIRHACSSAGPRLLSTTMQLVFGSVSLFFISPILGGVFLLSIPIFAYPMVRSGRRVSVLHSKSAESTAEAAGYLSERYSTNGAMLVKMFNSLGQEIHEFGLRAERLAKIGLRVTTATEVQLAVTVLIPAVVQFVVIALGGVLVFTGRVEVGFVVTAAMLLNQLYSQGMILLSSPADLAATSAAADRVAEVFRIQPRMAEPAHPCETPSGPFGFSLELVTFAYERQALGDGRRGTAVESRAVLRGLSMNVSAGESAALVGVSGAGKSTIGLLLSRFYDVDDGSVSLGGIDVREMSSEGVRTCVGLLPQNPFLFHGTIASNLQYAKPMATLDELWDALWRVQLGHLVEGLPDRLDSLVGDGGLRLSGGERQRLAIARLLLSDPPIVVLDEPTSHLDPGTERSVQDALALACAGKTTLTIAHRLATVVDAGRIFVIADGRIAQSGGHDELLDSGGLYAGMWHLQTSGESGRRRLEAR